MAKRKSTLTADILREFLDYDAKTGVFVWKYRSRAHFKSEKSFKTWNTKNAGKIAGYKRDIGYICIAINGTRYYAHRLAWMFCFGSFPENEIDHIDGDRSNNSLSNLREANRSENVCNTRAQVGRSSVFKGVCWDRTKNKWMACVCKNKKTKFLGYFEDEKLAAKASREGRKKMHGDFFKET